MKICIPVGTDNGMKSPVYGHFGSAPYFAIFDTDAKSLEMVANSEAEHEHGMCNPVGAIQGKNVNVVVSGGMGARAVAKLNAAGIRAYQASEGTVEEVVKAFAEGKLKEISSLGACQGHGCH